ncbi:solute carrier family 23 member 3 isoform X2 [Varanus komodoensis]|uniref:solute carrier family 23 member 3 isoform X2 n=1 Tax=Varanus komodoensis TaxID=61221 RepID=UPI001CF771AE|nr:solute carrier family 23 member 3 isoform X2 [Varanus komodoensis]
MPTFGQGSVAGCCSGSPQPAVPPPTPPHQHLLVQVSFLCIFHFLFITTLPHEEVSGTPHWDELLARNLFACGISTALQCGLGARLPLVQAPSFEFLIPAIVLTQHIAPIHHLKGNSTEVPDVCAGPDCENTRNWDQLFCEVLLPFCGIWLICGILRPAPTPWDMLHPSAHHMILTNGTLHSPWLKMPYPGEQGWPVFSPRAVGIGAAMGLAASVNSVGCYLLCSKALRDPPPPQHSCNRGLCCEGLGSLLSAVLGSISGTASSMPNACAGSLTQATSFRSVWVSALACVLLGLSPRLVRLLTTIPLGIHGGVLCMTYSVAVGTGVSYFQHTDIDSGRNIFIVGFTIFMGLLVPKWLFAAPESLATGWVPVDLFLLSLLMVPAFITGFLSFFLENTVSGTLQERGLLSHSSSCKPETGDNSWQQNSKGSAQRYELPPALRKHPPCSRCKGFPLCLLCPLEKDKEEMVNVHGLEELYHSEGEATDLLLNQGTVKLESELEPGTEQEPGIARGNLENHECGKQLDESAWWKKEG